MKPHYAGSVAFDNAQGEWQDELVMAFEFDEFVADIKSLMEGRQHCEVFFAVFKDKNGTEHDVTQKVRDLCE
tara:strand:+ start:338 stop:553 length:216 start_codon:yes stop_codon:yes gene_type:complete